jgi:hypothetical protein
LLPATASGFEPRSSHERRRLAGRAALLAHGRSKSDPVRCSDDLFRIAVRENHSIAGVLRAIGLRPAGANYVMVHRRVRELSLSTGHWTGVAHLRGRTHHWAKRMPLEEVLRNPTRYRGGTAALKERLFRDGILARHCARCAIAAWHGMPLALHLDHVNGDSQDNRRENLRVLCPNCHSQTPAYCGRNKGWRARGTSPASCCSSQQPSGLP